MNIIPAIDLKNGQCIRLLKGRFDQMTQYDIDPIKAAQSYQNDGATLLHIVDLDGAKNQSMAQTPLITAITQATTLTVQTGGGIRTSQQIEMLLSKGISRVVIGSLAVKEPRLVTQWINEFGNDRIVIALDVRFIDKDYYCATQGWENNSCISLWSCLENYSDIKYLLCTDIDRDGTLTGPNIALYQEILKRYPNILLQASGGIGSLSDLKELSQLNIDSVIVGKALYEKRFSLRESLLC